MENSSRVLFKVFVLLACLLGAFALLFLRPGSDGRVTGRRIVVERLQAAEAVAAPDVVPAAHVEPSAELADSDSLVRDLAAGLSSHPRMVAWLVNDDLLRRVVATVEDVASGYSPWQHLDFMRPSRPFRVGDQDGELVITDSTFRRYDRSAEVFASIDTRGAIELYVQLEPLLDEAHREVAPWNATFGERLDDAIDHLLEVPVPDGPLAVEAGVITFAYADPALEGLTDAQRHFLRMGPRNMRLVQSKLRDLQQALHELQAPEPTVPADQVAESAVDDGEPQLMTVARLTRVPWPQDRQGPW